MDDLNHERDASALQAALDALGAPAFVTDRAGRLHEANGAARAMDAADRQAVVAALRDVALQRPSAFEFRVTRLRRPFGAPNEEPLGYLAVLESGAQVGRAGASGRIAAATVQWGLTRRQAEVLAHVARGLATEEVAASIGIAGRTVEHHLTAVFDKAGVVGRAALVAALLEIAPR
ncbi:MAG: helix-turn-helix transcriptional regulator [Myxococcales bacterium]|jgi:DNA-binding CsgD family transcriptional regulator|nr:helix-turn-helix transcriptional regulator [Myxococcales bacterium]MBL0192666.1 helix-turn-helix transcriptional regulator [Myxococcales bacterium]HQY64496.1 helix-turn-helix transcriptional regulator [Polyangiaceae bacterium]